MKLFKYILLTFGLLLTNHAWAQSCNFDDLVNDLSKTQTTFKTIVDKEDGFKAWQILAEEAPKLRTNLDELELVSKNLVSIEKSGGYNKWKNVVISTGITTQITDKLIGRGLSKSVVDNIVLRSMYIDDVIGGNKMTIILDDLVSSNKFKNPEDLLENLKNVFSSGDNVSASNAKNLLKEFEEGKYWLDNGNEVYISKKWANNMDEVDVTITTKNTLVECKNLTGNDFRGLVNQIVEKYTIESKLSSSIKNQYPNHFGKISISNTNNEFYHLNKQQIITKFREQLFDKPGGITKSDLVNSVKELHIENGQGRVIIKNTEW